MNKLSVDIWSDIACPWCYVGKRRLEAALQEFPHRDAVTITWHSFELDPSAPAVQPEGTSYAERLAKKYGRSVAHAQGMIDNMTKVAAADGAVDVSQVIAIMLVIVALGMTIDRLVFGWIEARVRERWGLG